MNTLILLSIGLIACVGVLCTLVYTQLFRVLKLIQKANDAALRMEQAAANLALNQREMEKKFEQLASDVLQRDLYQSADDRHQLAIECARQGQDVFELIQRHGLSSDEAELIVSVHSPKNVRDNNKVKNANFSEVSHLDAV